MTPLSWGLIAALALVGTGLGSYLKGKKDGKQDASAQATAEAVKAQGEAIVASTAATAQLVEATERANVLDTEIRAQLSAGGLAHCADPQRSESFSCVWNRYTQAGQSNADRPEGGAKMADYMTIELLAAACKADGYTEAIAVEECIDRKILRAREVK